MTANARNKPKKKNAQKNGDTPILPEWTVIGFSGHRDVADPNQAGRGILAAIETIARHSETLAAISSVARGGDMIFLAAAKQKKIPYFALLPFGRELFEKTISEGEQKIAAELLDHALQVEELAAAQSADDSYLECGVVTVDRCDVLITLWRGTPAKGTGGTAEIVEYARVLGKPIVIVHPDSGALTTERLERLRSSAATSLPPNAASRETVVRLHDTTDKLALRQRPGFLQMILLHLGAEALAVFPLVVGLQGTLRNLFAGGELLLLVFALFLALRLKHVHHEWLKSRMVAELCRSFLALWSVPRRGTNLPRVPVPGLASLHRSLSMAWYMDAPATGNLFEARDNYLSTRIDQQIVYFEKRYLKVAPRFRALKRLAATGTFVAILTGAIALAMSLLHREGPGHQALELATMLLPLASAAILSLIVAEDYMRRAVRYRDMLEVLNSSAEKLKMTRTWAGFARIAVETEEKLLLEVLEWHSISMFLREPH